MQPQTEISGAWTAAAMCIAPVSPPMAREVFLRTCVVSASDNLPQRLMVLSGCDEARELPMSVVSLPPTIRKLMVGKAEIRVERIEWGRRLPGCAAPGTSVM